MRHDTAISELLEPRVLLSAELDEDVLRVNGSSHGDEIIIKVNEDNIVVKEDGKGTKFPLADVRKVKIRGSDGDDSIDCRESPRMCNVEGGDDDDTIYGSKHSDRLLGDKDEDLIKGNKGDDTIEGGNFADTLKGGAGNDQIFADEGDDRIFGDDGDDFLQAADDVWEDDVFGGAGNDRAVVDDDEAASDDVEEVEDIEDD